MLKAGDRVRLVEPFLVRQRRQAKIVPPRHARLTSVPLQQMREQPSRLVSWRAFGERGGDRCTQSLGQRGARIPWFRRFALPIEQWWTLDRSAGGYDLAATSFEPVAQRRRGD